MKGYQNRKIGQNSDSIPPRIKGRRGVKAVASRGRRGRHAGKKNAGPE